MQAGTIPAGFDYDAIIIGAGAAGLMTAIFAAERGRRVLLLEKARKPGVKILMSGGTRCNITHDCDNRGIVAAFGTNGKFLHSALAGFSPKDAVAFFNAEGVATKIEDTGKIFPVSDRALDVLNALLRRLERAGVAPTLAEPVRNLQPLPDGGFRVDTEQRTATAAKVVITTGGLSFPGCGTTGDGYGFARQFGHTIVPTRPALVPLTVQPAWVGSLKGITMPDITLKVFGEAAKPLATRRGSVLFAHFGLTGPAPLDVSRAVSSHPKPTALILEADLLPDISEQQLDQFVQTETVAHGKQLLAVVLSGMLPRRIADQVLAVCELPLDRKSAALSKADRQKIVSAVKHLKMPLRGTLGYEKAEVTAGGVSLEEVDSRTMQSKRMPNLYFAGEVLDLDGWIGGYNFQSAWSTGRQAGLQL